MGWLDLVATRYGCRVQGATQVAFTVLDVLGYLDEIPVCVGYELDGEEIDYFPSTTKLKRCKPILKKLPVGSATLVVLRITKTYLRTAVTILNLQKKKSVCQLLWFLTVLQEKILFTDNFEVCNGESKRKSSCS